MSMNALPEVITHNYHPDGVFLANLCDLPPDEAELVLQRYRDSGRRIIKANYLRRRLGIEAWLIAERQRLLGDTRRASRFTSFLAISPMGRTRRGPAPW